MNGILILMYSRTVNIFEGSSQVKSFWFWDTEKPTSARCIDLLISEKFRYLLPAPGTLLDSTKSTHQEHHVVDVQI